MLVKVRLCINNANCKLVYFCIIGIRTCLLCEETAKNLHQSTETALVEFRYCWKCGDKAYLESAFEAHFLEHQSLSRATINNDESTTVLSIDGVFLQEEVLSLEEEGYLISSIDSFDWSDSQSGRRKQDFGPKINFKKKKVNFTSFSGLPQLDMKLLEKIKRERLRDDANCFKFSIVENNSNVLEKDMSASILCNFKTVEVCHLEYWFDFLQL